MSTADDLIKDMRDDIDKALKSTNQAFTGIVVNDCYGTNDISPEYKVKLANAQKILLELRNDLA